MKVYELPHRQGLNDKPQKHFRANRFGNHCHQGLRMKGFYELPHRQGLNDKTGIPRKPFQSDSLRRRRAFHEPQYRGRPVHSGLVRWLSERGFYDPRLLEEFEVCHNLQQSRTSKVQLKNYINQN
ncbi:hypothetical protein AVEN_46053-1 [Araneus ventricosus]|uniref:Uncharacterized protein n=1 Tax=Araneus ventricosus TaxID=182803 RepID=A0A4Y2NHF1_ARAVE|nr:hypothetical protein AVEN_46053-1 [Araneus ventricosus]